MDTYPHVFFTSPDEWDPSVLDHDPPHLDGLDPSQVPDQPFGDPMFDAYGDFNEHIITNLNILLNAPPEDCGSYTEISSVLTTNLHHSSPQEPDWNVQLLCHLTLLMHQPPILSTLSKVSLVKMKIIQSPWPTLTFAIFLSDPSFYHMRIMGSATWPKSLTLMTMDNLLKTLNSS